MRACSSNLLSLLLSSLLSSFAEASETRQLPCYYPRFPLFPPSRPSLGPSHSRHTPSRVPGAASIPGRGRLPQGGILTTFTRRRGHNGETLLSLLPLSPLFWLQTGAWDLQMLTLAGSCRDLYIGALTAMQEADENDTTSYFQIAGNYEDDFWMPFPSHVEAHD